MTDYYVTVGNELLPELLSGQDGLTKLIESVLSPVLGVNTTGGQSLLFAKYNFDHEVPETESLTECWLLLSNK